MGVKTYLHRVAVIESRQVIMDVEAYNNIVDIKEKALEAYANGEGDQEIGLTYLDSVVIYPWTTDEQGPPIGSSYPERTVIKLDPEEHVISLQG